MRVILTIIMIALANLAQAAVISLNSSFDPIGRHDSQHESWVVIIAKGDSAIAFANHGIFDVKPICSGFKADEHLQPSIDRELLPFFAVGDTIIAKFQHQEGGEIQVLSITIGHAVVEVGKEITPQKSNRHLRTFRAKLRGQEILVDCYREQAPMMDEGVRIISSALWLIYVPGKGCVAHIGGPIDLRPKAREGYQTKDLVQ